MSELKPPTAEDVARLERVKTILMDAYRTAKAAGLSSLVMGILVNQDEPGTFGTNCFITGESTQVLSSLVRIIGVLEPIDFQTLQLIMSESPEFARQRAIPPEIPGTTKKQMVN